jgi:small subunit ribosomal protein S11
MFGLVSLRSLRAAAAAPGSNLLRASAAGASRSVSSSAPRRVGDADLLSDVDRADAFAADAYAEMPGASSGSRGVGSSQYRKRQLKADAAAHQLHVQASRNNTIITLARPHDAREHPGGTIMSTSGGTAGFKKSARSGYEAGYRAATTMFAALEAAERKLGDIKLDVVWKGFGQGRDAVFRALTSSEGEYVRARVVGMRDATNIKIGGVRPKKRRSEYLRQAAAVWAGWADGAGSCRCGRSGPISTCRALHRRRASHVPSGPVIC